LRYCTDALLVQLVLETFLSFSSKISQEKLNNHCTDALYHSIGSTGTSGTSPLDRHAFYSLHRRVPSYSIGSTGAIDLITVAILQYTGQFIFKGVS
jgi:hypothetical protein